MFGHSKLFYELDNSAGITVFSDVILGEPREKSNIIKIQRIHGMVQEWQFGGWSQFFSSFDKIDFEKKMLNFFSGPSEFFLRGDKIFEMFWNYFLILSKL